jgi:putative endonuclease
LDKYYVGSCIDLNQRLTEHGEGYYHGSYTQKANGWILYYSIDDLGYTQAKNVEKHIKSMKSRRYLENLKKYKEVSENLIKKYSSRG